VNFDEDKLAHDNPQLDAWVENKDGRVVCKGSLGIGSGPEPSYIRNLPLGDAHPEELRILSGLKNLVNLDPVEFLVEGDEEILSPSTIYHQLMMPFPKDSIAQPAVGFFGGTDIALHRGPIKGGMSYRKTAQIRSLGASPKTEFACRNAPYDPLDEGIFASVAGVAGSSCPDRNKLTTNENGDPGVAVFVPCFLRFFCSTSASCSSILCHTLAAP